MKLLFSLALIATILQPLRAQENADAERVRKTDELLANWAGKSEPGYAIGVVRDGRLVHAKGYGMANLEHGIAISSSTMFRLASVSKQFTAACIAHLALQKKLGLEDEVRTHIPEFPVFDEPIRISHLLHHTSGLTDYINLHERAKEKFEHITPTISLKRIYGIKKLRFAPSKKHEYSNSNYLLLGEIVFRVTGKSLRAYAHEEFFKPLGMKRTRFHDDHRELIPGRADGYSGRRRRGWRVSNTATDHVGDGGLFSSIDELFFWERFWTEPARLTGGAELQKIMLERGPLKDGKTTDYALGLVHGEWRGLKTVSHGGSWVGFRTYILRIPSEKLSVICLANFGGAKTHRMATSVAAVWATTAR